LHKDLIIEVIINSLAKPMQIGFYKRGKLVKQEEYDGLTSDILLDIVKDIVDKDSIKRFIYTNGPGSHMATKITYVILKSLNIIKGIDIASVSAFELNDNKPIKALGKLYFVKEKETIITKRLEDYKQSSFCMPDSLDNIDILEKSEPDYHITAV